MLNNSILKDMRLALGLSEDSEDFDTELLMFINSSIATLRQNGVILSKTVDSSDVTWNDLKQDDVESNEYFQMIPLYMKLKTKLLFDPPPPSTVDQYKNAEEELLWRLKTAYEKYEVDT